MLVQCVERCPDDLWMAPAKKEQDEERFIIRSYWRIVLHTIFFTHLYLGQDEAAFPPWPDRRKGEHEDMWGPPWSVEAFEMAEDTVPYSKQEALSYIAYVDGIIDSTVDRLDLDTANSGFPWYKTTEKMSHELMNLRHIQGHVGQLSELLMARGIDIDWVSRAPR